MPADGFDNDSLLKLAASLESKSEHPLAAAITRKAGESNIIADEAQGFSALPGHGVSAEINGKSAIGGNASLLKSKEF